MRYLVGGTLLIAGIIHLLPIAGILGSAQLSSLYGIPIEEPNVTILMRHRAVLFGLLGAFMMLAAFKRAFQATAFVAGFISVVSFLWLAASVGGYNDAIGRVVVADIVALVCLVVGAAAFAYTQREINAECDH